MATDPTIKLRQWRKYRGLTQIDLAKAAGINPATVHLLERTEQTVHPSTLRKIAKVFGCPPARLYFNP